MDSATKAKGKADSEDSLQIWIKGRVPRLSQDQDKTGIFVHSLGTLLSFVYTSTSPKEDIVLCLSSIHNSR